MSEMDTYLETIATGHFGRDVRAALHDAIELNANNISELEERPAAVPAVLVSSSPLKPSISAAIVSLTAKGNSKQNGDPTPAAPIPIQDASGVVTARTAADVEPQSNTITLPHTLRSVGEVKDELIVNEDGSGEVVQRVSVITYDGSADEDWKFSSGFGAYIQLGGAVRTSKGGLLLCNQLTPQVGSAGWKKDNSIGLADSYNLIPTVVDVPSSLDEWRTRLSTNPLIVYYCLESPIRTPLTSSEVADILKLQTYKGTTIIDAEVEAEVGFALDIKDYVDERTSFSYTEQKIGKWADGSDLYRMVIQTTTPNAVGSATKIANLNGADNDIKNIYGTVESQTNAKIPINFYFNSSIFVTTYVDAEGIKMMNAYNGYANKPCEIVIEYTKKNASREMPAPMMISEEPAETNTGAFIIEGGSAPIIRDYAVDEGGAE